MDEVAVSTVVYLPPEEIYEFLVDFPRYADYSRHLRDVRQSGDGSPGTRYALYFSWWKLTYTTESKVTDVTPPARIDWTITKGVHAVGRWRVEELDDLPHGGEAPPDADAACHVFFKVEYDPDSVSADDVDLPRFVSLGWVVDKLRPVLQKEAERIVERIVADIEGRPRRVELTIHSKPRS